ncbi:dienelactone hydrolase family protein [Actinokineospora sp. PR83]|uniref:alpha/beta hydrolase family protein n=1 Tax=Actinokineospora sp. PR83 TaxID=2884908 RepID=UPI001F3AB1E2|nr:dienelactone hydrolase family protein [Actinokineospora sp. PR83]MCG8914533.1 dienelactone hydrolase family protein [Actinokineospora sp. PR83]
MPFTLRKSLIALASAAAVGAGALTVTTGAEAAPVAVAPAAVPVHGVDPTDANLRQPVGDLAFSKVTIADSQTPGFGAATIYYPDDTTHGTYGGVAVVPGYTSPQSAVAWLGPRLASRGFVVITIATNSIYDQPTTRGRELLSALDYLTTSSPAAVRQRLDPNRLAVMGHSMGGGGALYAVSQRSTIKAAVPLAPYNQDKTWPEVKTPTMLMAGSADNVAGIGTFSRPFYRSMTGARERALVNVQGADHGTFVRENATIGKYATAWLKRFVDEDTRYDKFLCPAPTGDGLAEYTASCPNT